MLSAFQHQLCAAQNHLRGIFLRFGAGQAAGHAAVGQSLNKLVHPCRAAAGNAAGGIDQTFRHGIQTARRSHDPEEGFFFLSGDIAGTVLDHTLAHRSRGVGHDADHRKVLTGHLLNTGDRKARCHAAQHKTAGALVKGELERLEQSFHHLGLYRQKDQAAVTGHLGIGGCFAAQFFGQCLCLGRSAVCQKNFLRVNSFANGTGDGSTHVAAAQKTNGIHHSLYPPSKRHFNHSRLLPF